MKQGTCGFLMALGFFLSSIVMAPAQAQSPMQPPSRFSAKILDKADQSKLLYNYNHESKTDGEKRTVKNTFTSPGGETVATEDVEFEGGQVKMYRQVQNQTKSDGKIEVKGDDLIFTHIKDGKSKSAKEKKTDNFVVGPSIVSYLQGRWSDVTGGKDISVRMGVVDRRETVGFTFKKVNEIDYKGQKAVVVRMKPTSFVIAALVDPLHFTFAADGSRLLELNGRVIPKREEGGKFKDLDAITVYEYM